MKKVAMVCMCIGLMVGLPYLSVAASPQPIIQPLVLEQRRVTLLPNGDPDGPYAGGLDDPTDWINLVASIGNLMLIPGYLLALSYIISEPQGLRSIPSLIWYFLLIYWGLGYGALGSFTDAFDLRDPDEDGR